MKKILYLMLLSLGIFTLGACSSDSDNTEDTTNALKIVSSDITFTAAGGTGSIQVQAPGAITATADQSWCTVAASGTTVSVTVPELDKLEGRSSLITIKYGNDSTQVTASQAGYIFALSAGSAINANDAQQTLSYKLKATVPVTFQTAADWFTAKQDGDSLRLAFTENTTGHPRFAVLKYSCGPATDSIRICQYDFAKDIAGSYAFAGYSISQGKNIGLNCTVAMDAKGAVTLNLTDFGWVIPVTFDAANCSFQIFGNAFLGTYTSGSNTYNIYTCFWDGDKGYLTWSTSISITGTFAYDDAQALTYAEILDNGSWSGYHINILRFEYYLGTSRKGYLLALMNPMLIKQ